MALEKGFKVQRVYGLDEVRTYLDELGLYTQDIRKESRCYQHKWFRSEDEDSLALHWAKLNYGPDAYVRYSTNNCWYLVIAPDAPEPVMYTTTEARGM